MIASVLCPFCESSKDVDLPLPPTQLMEEHTSVVRCDDCDNRYLVTYAMTMRTASSAILDTENSAYLTGIARDIHNTVGIK